MILMETPPAQIRFSPAKIRRNSEPLRLLTGFFGLTTTATSWF